MTRTEKAIWVPPSGSKRPSFTSSLPAMHFTSALHLGRTIMCVSICFLLDAYVLVCLCAFLSQCCTHCPSHRSVYWWGCNYVPQWSSLCFFTAQELSRQRSVCALWKLPAENHMAMRAIMDFFSPPSQDSSVCLLHILFLSILPFVSEQLSRCQSMCAFWSNLRIWTPAALEIISTIFFCHCILKMNTEASRLHTPK